MTAGAGLMSVGSSWDRFISSCIISFYKSKSSSSCFGLGLAGTGCLEETDEYKGWGAFDTGAAETFCWGIETDWLLLPPAMA